MLYSLHHINSISPYQVIKDTEETVRFITDDGVEYMVAFIEDDNLEIDHAYQLVISNISKTKTKGPFLLIIRMYCYLYVIFPIVIRQPATGSSLHDLKSKLDY